jgi:hypothetical protein
MRLKERFRKIRTAFTQELRTSRLLCDDQRVLVLPNGHWGQHWRMRCLLSIVPVIGHLDDLLIVPGLILFALWLIPPAVVAECRERAQRQA